MEVPAPLIDAVGNAARKLATVDQTTQRHKWLTGVKATKASEAADKHGTALEQLTEQIGHEAAAKDVARAVTLLGEFSTEVREPGLARDGVRELSRQKLAPAVEALESAFEQMSGKPLRSNFESRVRALAGLTSAREDAALAEATPIIKRGKSSSTSAAKTPEWNPAPINLDPSYGSDVTALAAQGQLEPVVGRDEEILEALEILTRKRQNNVAIIGEAGVGKTALVEGLAQLIVEGKAPGLENTRIISMNTDGMNSMWRGQFEQRLLGVVKLAQDSGGKVILFADEMHRLLSSGAHSNDPSPGGNILKPALARGMKMIGATTLNEFRTGVETDGAFARRFEQVLVEAPNDETSRIISRRVADKLADDYAVTFEEGVPEIAADIAGQYVKSTPRPDSILKILTPAATSARRDGGVVTIEHLRNAASKVAGVPIPLGKTDDVRAQMVLNAEEELGKLVFGQEAAVNTVSRALRRAEAGLKAPQRPIGSFAFLGPTGTGKTELARAVAKLLFDDPERMMRIDGSEFQHAGSELRLTSGKDGAGELTEYVRRNPYSVILFDEIEKANPAMHKLLLQILDAGRLTDTTGRIVDFSNTVVVMTSNAGSREILEAGSDEARRKVAQGALRERFAPELYNRIDEIVSFRALNLDEMRNVAKKLANEEVAQLTKRKDINIEYSSDALDLITEAGFSQKDGARPIRRAVQRFVSDEITVPILDGSVENGSTVKVGAEGKELVFTVDEKEIGRSLPYKLDEEVDTPKIEPANNQDMQEMIRNLGNGNNSFGR